MRHLDLFSGISGFPLAVQNVFGRDHVLIGLCEKEKQCRQILQKKWPGVKIWELIQNMMGEEIDTVELLTGGDPCPIRSKARKIHNKIINPDLSGYFLAVCGRCRPRWILRENVPAPDDVHFTTALEMLGYRSLIIRTDAAAFTGQQRIRDIIVASNIAASWESAFFGVFKQNGNPRYHSPRIKEKPLFACLTTHRTRWDARDNFIYDGRLRVLDGKERIRLAGFPEGWLNGVSESAIARMTGNAVVPAVIEEILKIIKSIESAF